MPQKTSDLKVNISFIYSFHDAVWFYLFLRGLRSRVYRLGDPFQLPVSRKRRTKAYIGESGVIFK